MKGHLFHENRKMPGREGMGGGGGGLKMKAHRAQEQGRTRLRHRETVGGCRGFEAV